MTETWVLVNGPDDLSVGDLVRRESTAFERSRGCSEAYCRVSGVHVYSFFGRWGERGVVGQGLGGPGEASYSGYRDLSDEAGPKTLRYYLLRKGPPVDMEELKAWARAQLEDDK